MYVYQRVGVFASDIHHDFSTVLTMIATTSGTAFHRWKIPGALRDWSLCIGWVKAQYVKGGKGCVDFTRTWETFCGSDRWVGTEKSLAKNDGNTSRFESALRLSRLNWTRCLTCKLWKYSFSSRIFYSTFCSLRKTGPGARNWTQLTSIACGAQIFRKLKPAPFQFP